MNERCANPECGHSMSAHNSLGYCRRTSQAKGDCMCESFVRLAEEPQS